MQQEKGTKRPGDAEEKQPVKKRKLTDFMSVEWERPAQVSQTQICETKIPNEIVRIACDLDYVDVELSRLQEYSDLFLRTSNTSLTYIENVKPRILLLNSDKASDFKKIKVYITNGVLSDLYMIDWVCYKPRIIADLFHGRHITEQNREVICRAFDVINGLGKEKRKLHIRLMKYALSQNILIEHENMINLYAACVLISYPELPDAFQIFRFHFGEVESFAEKWFCIQTYYNLTKTHFENHAAKHIDRCMRLFEKSLIGPKEYSMNYVMEKYGINGYSDVDTVDGMLITSEELPDESSNTQK